MAQQSDHTTATDARLFQACLHLCTLPIGSPEREAYWAELAMRWSAKAIWDTITRHPAYFEWSLSIRGARLSPCGRQRVGASPLLPRLAESHRGERKGLRHVE